MGLLSSIFGGGDREQTTTNETTNNITSTSSAIEDSAGAIIASGNVNVTDGGAFDLVGDAFNRYQLGFNRYADTLNNGFGQALNVLSAQSAGQTAIARENAQLAQNITADSMQLALQADRGEGENVLLAVTDSMKWLILAIAGFMIFKGLSS